MRLLPADERGLRRALELAREATAFASPNPTVGCVLLREEEILGEGAHYYNNFDHAEIAALKQAAAAGRAVRGATACVTLEPCAHHGRTGPCSDALIASGIARCLVATIDPNPLVRGKGLARLSAAGVEVLVLPPDAELAQEARRLNDAFAFAVQRGRPFVTLKAAVSRDGKIAPALSMRTAVAPHWITGEFARADVQELRYGSDALLTGIGTVLADDPALTDRTGLPRRRPLLRVVVDSQLRTPRASRLVHSVEESRKNDLLIACVEDASAAREKELQSAGVEVLRLPREEGRVDLLALLQALTERRIRSVLVEGGSALNGSLLRAELADKVVFYRAASELGADALPFAEAFGPPGLIERQLHSIERATFPNGRNEDVRISGYLHDPWAGV